MPRALSCLLASFLLTQSVNGEATLEFREIARRAALPLYIQNNDNPVGESAVARSERLIHELLTLHFTRPDYREWSARLLALHHKIAVKIAKLQMIDKYRPGGVDAALAFGGASSMGKDSGLVSNTASIGTILRLGQLHEQANTEVKDILGDRDAILTELAKSEYEVLARAPSFAGPPSTRTAVCLDYNASWNSNDPHYLFLQNCSGQVLHNSTIQVRILNPSGEGIANVHFAGLWQPDQWIKPPYRPASTWNFAERPDLVDRLFVSIYSDELRQLHIPYQYSGAARNSDLEWYTKDVTTPKVEFLNFEKGIFVNDDVGVAVTLPGGVGQWRMNVTLGGPGNSVALEWKGDGWPAGQRKVFRDARWNFRVASIAVTLIHPATGWRKEFGTWTVQ